MSHAARHEPWVEWRRVPRVRLRALRGGPANPHGARPLTDDVLEAIRADLPRQIRGLEVNDPILTLYGDDWSLTLMCPWKVEAPGGGFGWESESIEDEAWELVGHSLLSVSPTDVYPVFELSEGSSSECPPTPTSTRGRCGCRTCSSSAATEPRRTTRESSAERSRP